MANAMGIKAGSAYVELLLSDSKFVKGLDKAGARLRAFGSGIVGMGRRLSAVTTSVLSVMGAAAGVFNVTGDAIAKSAARTGASAEALSSLAYVAELSGSSFEVLEGSIRKMQKTLVDAAKGSAGATDALQRLGLSIEDLRGLSPDEQFKLIADRLSKVQSPALRTALALKIFGKSGAQLLPMMQDGARGIERLQQQARDLGLVMSTEDAKAAAHLHDTLDILWKVLKRTSVVIGTSLAPVLIDAATWVTNLVVRANDWIKQNRGLIVSVFKIVATVGAAAVALMALGTVISGLGSVFGTIVTIAGGVGTAIAGIGTVLAAILSPIGLVITAVLALGAYLIYATDVGAAALAWLSDRFTELKEFAYDAFGGIADALAAGDIALAAKILWLTLKVAWEKGVGWIQSIWLSFRNFFIRIAYDAFYGALAAWEIIQHGLTVAWIETTAFLSNVWSRFTAGFQQAWGTAINWTSKRMLELMGLFDETLDVDAAKKLVDDDLAQANAQIEARKNQELASREKQRQAERKQETAQHEAEMIRINDDAVAKERALKDDHAKRLKEAEDDLAKAKKELADAVGEAKQKRQDTKVPQRTERPKGLPDDFGGIAPQLEQARQATIGVAGTFNAFEVRGMAAGGVSDRIARASEETARNTKRMLDELEDMEGAEFE